MVGGSLDLSLDSPCFFGQNSNVSSRRTDLPVLIIQHAQHEHPAAMRRALHTQGIRSLWIHPYRRQAYPTLDSISGIISLGGPMGANDDEHHPWIPIEVALLREAVERGLPVAGICLGGQMLARAMGGRVEKHSTAEVGWLPIELNDFGKKDRVLGSAGPSPLIYQWHMDTFHLPPGAQLLASSPACPRQAYKLSDQVYGFQFHPEADHQLVHEWLDIPGVEDEIRIEQQRYGSETVQPPDMQRDLATKGERASLKITAGIGQLFKLHDYQPVSASVRLMLEEFATHRWELEVVLESPDQREFMLRGTVATLLTVDQGDFMILRDQDAMLWPIRLDYARKITPVSR